jgi:hypothetical protein
MVRRAKLDSTPTTSPPPSAAVSTRAAKMAAPHSGGPRCCAAVAPNRPAEWSFAAEGLFCYTFRRKEAQVLSWKE